MGIKNTSNGSLGGSLGILLMLYIFGRMLNSAISKYFGAIIEGGTLANPLFRYGALPSND